MWALRIPIVIGVTAGLVLASVAVWAVVPSPASRLGGLAPAYGYPRVLFREGRVLHFPGVGVNGTVFTLPPGGGWIEGRAKVDHFLNLGIWPFPTVWACPAMPLNETYVGAPWNYSVGEHLAGGTWFFGPGCYVYGNVTVTQSFVIF